MNFREIHVPVGLERVPALYYQGQQRGGAVVVISDINGPDATFEDLAQRLAAQGFSVLLPDYFFRQGPVVAPGIDAAIRRRTGLDEARSVDDFFEMIDWFKSQMGVHRMGVLGFCMGGTFALDLASMREDLVTVAYYGFPRPQDTIAHPPPRPIDLVQDLSGPVLAFWGAEDKGIGQGNILEYVRVARRYSRDFTYEIIPGLGHAFLRRANLDDPQDLGGATWTVATTHLRSHLVENLHPSKLVDLPSGGGRDARGGGEA